MLKKRGTSKGVQTNNMPFGKQIFAFNLFMPADVKMWDEKIQLEALWTQ